MVERRDLGDNSERNPLRVVQEGPLEKKIRMFGGSAQWNEAEVKSLLWWGQRRLHASELFQRSSLMEQQSLLVQIGSVNYTPVGCTHQTIRAISPIVSSSPVWPSRSAKSQAPPIPRSSLKRVGRYSGGLRLDPRGRLSTRLLT